MERRKIQENKVKALMSTVDSLGSAIDLMTYDSPWRNELVKMSISVSQMRVAISNDLSRLVLQKFDPDADSVISHNCPGDDRHPAHD